MSNPSLRLLFMSALSLIFQASALQQESLNGQNVSPPQTFTYQVGIFGRINDSLTLKLFCDGGIIAPNLVISAAVCFVAENGTHRPYTFSVFSDVTNLNIAEGFEILVDLIYLFQKGPIKYHNLAVTKLERPFDFVLYPHLRILDIPEPNEEYWEDTGAVAGHGYYYYVIRQNPFGNRELISSGTDYKLRNGTVRVSLSRSCRQYYKYYSFAYQFCGLMNSPEGVIESGICKHDTGSPLVINSKVIGVAGTPNRDCDDTKYGSLYAMVSKYAKFVNEIINGNPLTSTITYKNREHIHPIHQDNLIEL